MTPNDRKKVVKLKYCKDFTQLKYMESVMVEIIDIKNFFKKRRSSIKYQYLQQLSIMNHKK